MSSTQLWDHTKKLLIVLLWIHTQNCTPVQGQIPAPTFPDSLTVSPLPGDTLPAITMKFEPAYLILWLTVPGSMLFIGGHSYEIKGKKMALATRVQPYFEATRDPLLPNLYQQYRCNRIIWYSCSGAGSIMAGIGFVHGLASIFNPTYARAANSYLLLGGTLMAGGLIARVVCFQHLRKAINLYNYQYAGKKPVLSMELGTSSATPAGAALYLKF